MAATVAARRLTEAHRLTQARLGARTVQGMRAVWPLLDPADLDGTFEQWLTAVDSIVGAQRVASARLAANYVTTFKTLELGTTIRAAPVVLMEDLVPRALTTSMLVTGLAAVKAATRRGTLIDLAMEGAEATSAAAAMRHALAGGRDTIVETVRADRQAIGWARAVSGSGCAFCAMLASRGPVYDEDAADFEAHDGCACTAEPVYRADAEWPAGGDRYRDLWNESTVGLSGQDAVNAFRRALSAT